MSAQITKGGCTKSESDNEEKLCKKQSSAKFFSGKRGTV